MSPLLSKQHFYYITSLIVPKINENRLKEKTERLLNIQKSITSFIEYFMVFALTLNAFIFSAYYQLEGVLQAILLLVTAYLMILSVFLSERVRAFLDLSNNIARTQNTITLDVERRQELKEKWKKENHEIDERLKEGTSEEA